MNYLELNTLHKLLTKLKLKEHAELNIVDGCC